MARDARGFQFGEAHTLTQVPRIVYSNRHAPITAFSAPRRGPAKSCNSAVSLHFVSWKHSAMTTMDEVLVTG